MKRWKPLIASLVVIALAWGGLAVWKFKSAGTSNTGGGNAPVANTDDAPDPNIDPNGLEYETVPLDKLPQLDPLALWPNDGMRISSVDFWVMWQTTGYSKCRLLGTSDQRNWVDLGRTSADGDHFLPMNMAYFGSQATFAVEFQTGGKRYRSKPRTVSFGYGAHFQQRDYRLNLSTEQNQTWPLALGGDIANLNSDSFRWTFASNDNVIPFWADPADGHISFGVQEPAAIRGDSSMGFLQLYDGKTDAYDRALIRLQR